MDEKLTTWPTLEVVQNRTVIFIPFSFSDPTSSNISIEKLEQISEDEFLQNFISAHKSSRSADLIWTRYSSEKASSLLSNDLLPIVDRILHGGVLNPDASCLNETTPPFKLQSNVFKEDFYIHLRQAAKVRLMKSGLAAEHAEYIRFRFGEVKLYLFASKRGVMTLEVEFLPIHGMTDVMTSDLLIEGIYALSHPDDRGETIFHGKIELRTSFESLESGSPVHIVSSETGGKRVVGVSNSLDPQMEILKRDAGTVLFPSDKGENCFVYLPGDLGELSILSLANALLGLADNADVNRHSRLFSLCYTKFPADTAVENARLIAYALGGKYNREYAIRQEDVTNGILSLFGNIHFSTAIQGGAVVVCAGSDDNTPEHLNDFYNKAVREAYLPLSLVSYHEYLHLSGLTQRIVHLPNSTDLVTGLSNIKTRREELLNFRLSFRFSHVSSMSHHNKVHHAWRSALSLDSMLDELTKDVAEADSVLDTRLSTEQQKQWRSQQTYWKEESKQRQLKLDEEKEEKERNEKKFKLVGSIGVSLSALTILHELIEIIAQYYYSPYKWLLLLLKGDGTDWQSLMRDKKLVEAFRFYNSNHTYETWAFGVSFLLAILAGTLFYKYSKKIFGH